MSSYLVTGSSGMIGSQVLEKLKDIGWNHHTLDRKEIGECNNQKELVAIIYDKIKRSNGVFHIGAIADTSDFSTDVMYYNYHITKLIVDVCIRLNTRLVFSSTQMVTGRSDVGYPENLYGWSKVACEDYIHLKAKRWGEYDRWRGIILRYTNVYGPGEQSKGKTASLAYQGWLSKEIELWDAKRDFIYVKDIVDANIHAMCNLKDEEILIKDGVFWVGSGESRSAIEFVRGMGNDIIINEKNPNEAPPWFQWETSCDPNEFMSGWKPEYNLEKGTEDYLIYLGNI